MSSAVRPPGLRERSRPESTLRLVEPGRAPKTMPSGRAAGVHLVGGEYRLDSLLAVGGMGSVWAGTHVTLGRRVAVKFVDVGTPRSADVVRRFLREARLAARVRHPHVVDVLDFGLAEDGEPVIVMELLEGDTLQTRTKVGPRLTAAEAVQVTLQLLSALDAVHRAGVLHLDTKPSNVVLEPNETFARLLDFGIASAKEPAPADLRRRPSGEGAFYVAGTPEYMSPEQAEGELELDERADVYAASVILYELLTGVSPFADEHPSRTLCRVMLGDHVPLATLRPDLGELAHVVDRGMAHDREDRPTSARELRRALIAAARTLDLE